MSLKTLAKVTIASTGTPQKLNATSLNARLVIIQSVTGNNAAGGNIGDSAVTGPGNTGSTPGLILAPNTSQLLPFNGAAAPYDLSQIFVNGTTGDVFTVLYDI
jgi:hypothetical protein